nr:hypothetical protein HK105_003915 [Polyrhizophydium stewartii]
MIVIVAATHRSLRAEVDLAAAKLDPDSLSLYGLPKGLFPLDGRPSLTCFKQYERWAMEVGLDPERVLSTGTSDQQDPMDAVLDALRLALKLAQTGESDSVSEITILGDDFVPDPAVTGSWRLSGPNSASVLDSSDGRPLLALKFHQSLASAVLRFVEQELLHSDVTTPTAFERLLVWLDKNASLHRQRLPQDHPLLLWMSRSLSLSDYLSIWRHRVPTTTAATRQVAAADPLQPIHSRVCARIGLIGNPSDGFFGRTISTVISNFWAEVTLVPNARSDDTTIAIRGNPICDPFEFGRIQAVRSATAKDGYDGAVRLFLATMSVFVDYCLAQGVDLSRRGASVLYRTNIPRQVGLAGSSALVTAFLKALIAHYAVPESVLPLHIQPNLALSAERDQLGIAAGHQDRVVQAYGGCVFMDFDKAHMTTHGYGKYEQLPPDIVPQGLWMAYVRQPKESGKVHNNIKSRFQQGDPQVIAAMSRFAAIATEAREALLAKNRPALARLMDSNFDQRRELYGDAVIGPQTLRMIELARAHGHAAKLSGSGGCVIGLRRDADESTAAEQTRKLRLALEREGFVFCFVRTGSEANP